MNFENRDFTPMLIGKEATCFDDEDYIYEIKMDGVRCLAYLDENQTFLQNKRGLRLNAKFPELRNIHKQVKKRCILDGELYVFKNGRSDFFEIQKRTLMSDAFKIRMQSQSASATFTAFDLLYVEDELLIQKPLIERKKQLDKLIIENTYINISRYIEGQGNALFELSKKKHLEGIVAKPKHSKYYPGKRSKDWIKCKNLLDEDFVITGYIPKEKHMVSLILAQYEKQQLIYKGHVTMGVSMPYLLSHTTHDTHCPFADLPQGNDEAIWIKPFLVGTVKFMEYTSQGGLRQPVFKGFRDDKKPKECVHHI